MHKKKTSNKYSKKTRKNKNVCKKGITDEVIKLNKYINDVLNNNTDLINIRDELVGNADQLKYLLTFK